MLQKQLNDYDNLTTQLLTQAETSIAPELEIRQNHARLDLREKQMTEMSEAMRTLSPSQELIKRYEEEARAAKREAAEYKVRVLKQLEDELARQKEERRRQEEERKRKLLSNLA